MKGDHIPDSDHISRFCRPMQVADGQIQASAFMLRADEENLSVNWLEFLKCSSREDEVLKIQDIYSANLTVGASAKIAVLNVGEVRYKILTESLDSRNIEVLHDPLEDDLSHSEIYNLKQDNELIAELILETVHESGVYPARRLK